MSIGKVNRVILLALCLWGLTLCDAWASYHISGVVRDRKSKEPLAGAFVLAYADDVQKGFAYSGADGQFSLQIQDGESVDVLKVSMMGYAPESVPTGGKTSGFVIELKEQALQLSSAAVKSNSVTRRGDTLSFYVRAFTDGTEQVLDDLINKIPGLATNEQGTIQYEGEAINRFYVEGLDLMGGRYGVVTKNLKASDIARIDVYRNHQPVNALREIDPSEKSAVNIVLKESARGSWVFTGDALLGLPPFPLFDAKAMVSRFGKTSQDLYLLKGNNLGKDITQELREQPGVSDGRGVILISNEIDNQLSSALAPSYSSLPVPREFWYDNLSGLATFNHLARTGENGSLRLSLSAAAEKYAEQAFSSETVSFEDGTSLAIDDRQSLTDRKYYLQGQATYEYNGPDRYLSESFSLSGQLRSDLSDGTGHDNYEQRYDLPSFKADNTLRLTLRRGKGAVNSTSAATYVRNMHTATCLTGGRALDQSYFQNDLTSSHGASWSIATGRHSLSASADVGLDYLDRKVALTSSSGIGDLADAVSGPLQGSLSVLSFCPSLSLRDVITIGNVRLVASLPATLNILQVNGKAGAVHPSVSPSLSLRYTPTANLAVNAGVSYSLQHSSPESLLDAAVMRNYRYLSRPDSLARSDRITAMAAIRYSDPVSMLFIDLNGGYGRLARSKTASSKYFPDMTVTGYVPLQNATALYNVDGSIRKYFGGKTFVLEGQAGYDVAEMDEYLQRVLVHYTTRRFRTGGEVGSNPADWFSVRLKVEYVRQITEHGGSGVRSHILTGEGSMRISPVRQLSLDLSGYFRRERIPGVTVSNKPLLKVALSWRLPKGTVCLECNNVLDIKEYRRETVSAYRTVSAVNRLRGRQFLAGFRMSF